MLQSTVEILFISVNFCWSVKHIFPAPCMDADVASMIHTVKLSNTYSLVEVQMVKILAIAAIPGFAENGK